MNLRDLINKLDRDKEMSGFQIAPGGIRGGVQRVKQAFQSNPQQFNVLSPTAQRIGINNLENSVKPQLASPALRTATNFAANTLKIGEKGGTDISTGLQRTFKGEPLQGIAQTIRGAGNYASLMPPFRAITGISTLGTSLDKPIDKNDLVRRVSSGFTEGYSGINPTTSNINYKNINLKVPLVGDVSFDPARGVGNMAGFVKNPVNQKFFKLTESIFPDAAPTVMKWLASTSARGGIENIIQNLPEMPDNLSTAQKSLWMAQNGLVGAAQEVGGRVFFKGLGKVGNVTGVNKTVSKGAEFTQAEAAKLFDTLSEFKRKWSIPVKMNGSGRLSGQEITAPMWKWKLGLVDDGRMQTYSSTIDTPKLSVEPVGDSNKFYINKYADNSGKNFKFEEVAGKKVEIIPGVETFIHKNQDGMWTVTEARSGQMMTNGKTQAEAISKAREASNKMGKEKLLSFIEDKVTRNGISPRYAQSNPPSVEPVGGEGIKLYRGATPENMLKDKGRGISFATEKDVADRFSKSDFTGFNYSGGKVGEYTLPKSAKILDASTLTANQIKGSLDRENIIKYAKDNGYDAVDLSKQIDPVLTKAGYLPEKEIRVLNPKVLSPLGGKVGGEVAKVDPFIAGLEKDKADLLKGKTKTSGSIMGTPPKSPTTLADDEVSNAKNMALFAGEDPEGKQFFNKTFAEWVGKRDSAYTKGTQVGSQFAKVDPKLSKEIIQYREGSNLNVSPQAKAIADKIKTQYDSLFAQAKADGIDMNYLDNYITHIWKESPEIVSQKYKTAGQKFGFSKERTVPTYEEGIKIGLTPKYTNPGQIVGEYVKKLERTKANLELFNTMKLNGYIVPASIGSKTPGFEPINAPGFPSNKTRIDEATAVVGRWYAPREVAQQINRVFTPEDTGSVGKVIKIAGDVSGKIQDITLSGGLPGTPINAFSTAQILKEVTAGRVKSPLSAIVTSLSPEATQKYFEKNADQIIKMQEKNIPIRSSYSIEDLAKTDPNTKTFGERLGGFWNAAVSDPTFKRFLPQLQINLFNDIESKALSNGKSAQEAVEIASKAVKNFYGVIGSDTTAKRTELTKDTMKTLTFAPQYRESIVNMWINSIKGLKNPLAPENITNTKFLVGAALTYFTMDRINYSLNGRHLNENPEGKEDKLLIPTKDGTTIGVPFLSSIATVPRGLYRIVKQVAKADIAGASKEVVSTFGSQPIKTFGEIGKNEDYFGKEIYNPDDPAVDKLKDQAGHVIKSNMHPWVKAGIEAPNTPAYQTASKALELPFRFYKTDSLNKNEFYSKMYDDLKPVVDKYYDLKKSDPTKAQAYFSEHQKEFAQYKQMEQLAKATKETGNQKFMDSLDLGKPKFKSGTTVKITKAGATDKTTIAGEPIVTAGEDGSISTINYDKYTGKAPTDAVEKVRWEKDRFTTATKIYRAEGLSDQEKNDYISKMGVKPDEVAYYDIASDSTDVKRAFVDNAIAQSKDKIGILSALRREVGGKMILANGVIDDLEDDGILTDSEAKYLKSLKWDQASSSIKIKAGKKKKISVTRSKVSPIKVTISKPRYQSNSMSFKPIKSIKIAPLKKRSIKII